MCGETIKAILTIEKEIIAVNNVVTINNKEYLIDKIEAYYANSGPVMYNVISNDKGIIISVNARYIANVYYKN